MAGYNTGKCPERTIYPKAPGLLIGDEGEYLTSFNLDLHKQIDCANKLFVPVAKIKQNNTKLSLTTEKITTVCRCHRHYCDGPDNYFFPIEENPLGFPD